MPNKKYRPQMSPEDRAKQFMPFAALKGYEEALRRVEALSENNFNNLVEHIKEDESESEEEK
ncbi:MAG: hypothetical protein MJ123_11310 [Lachnospiraceae bacterium]|nr:hypothetical protein [Lachnospiraceae bacterium]